MKVDTLQDRIAERKSYRRTPPLILGSVYAMNLSEAVIPFSIIALVGERDGPNYYFFTKKHPLN